MAGERTYYPVSDHSGDQGVSRILRDAPPAHYSLKIESFSSLANLAIEKYESAAFDAGRYTSSHGHLQNYTWRLVIYPKGNTKRGGQGHISVYVALDKTDWLPPDWEVYATYKIFVYDHHKDKYLTIQDDPLQEVRFHPAKKETGFDKLISLDIFNDATNGYLVDDSCIFGVEIYPVRYTGRGETLKMNVVDRKQVTFEWKIPKLSKIIKRNRNGQHVASEQFAVGKHKWRLLFYPNGDTTSSKDSVALFLEFVDQKPSTAKKVLAEFSLRILNQISNTYRQSRDCKWFSSTNNIQSNGDETTRTSLTWGSSRFMLLSDLQNESSSLKQRDTLVLQAKVNIKAEVSYFS